MAPVTIRTTTHVDGLAYPGQRKQAVLASGRLIEAISDTSSNAKFYYSDDAGATWTDMASDIVGWKNGSLVVVVDGSGNERLMVVWDQNGTGGGRTDGIPYEACGVLNGGQTAVTWNINAVFGGTDSTYNFPVIVACPEGTGITSHTFFSYAGTGVYMARSVYNSSGSRTSVTSVGNISGGSPTGELMPAACIHPTLKHIYLVYSWGATGAGLGISFRMWTYSGGTWTAANKRDVNTSYRATSTLGSSRWINVKYDPVFDVVIIAGCPTDAAGTADLVMAYSRPVTDIDTQTTIYATAAGSTNTIHSGDFIIDGIGNLWFVGAESTHANVVYMKIDRGGAADAQVTIESLSSQADFGNAHAERLVGVNKMVRTWLRNSGSPWDVRADSMDLPGSGHQLINAA